MNKSLNKFVEQKWRYRPAVVAAIVAIFVGAGCTSSSAQNPESPSMPFTPQIPSSQSKLKPEVVNIKKLLEDSWNAYRQRFIQPDGRVIDFEDGDRSISEGQAYAMLRAFFADDPVTFAKTLEWAENNLSRKLAWWQIDRLWAWKWGQDEQGNWRILDSNFASDADIDAIFALILAGRHWNREEYLDLARAKLEDLWRFSTATTPDGKRYLLPGPRSAFQTSPFELQLNPSYFAPYAFRLFAQVDPDRDWLSLVDSSYEALEKSTKVSRLSLPSDWVALDTRTGEFQPLLPPRPIQSQYSFDAYRVWWRVYLDAVWFKSPQAIAFLEEHLEPLKQQWRIQQRIPARINLLGQPMVDYEATSQYGMLYAAFSLTEPRIAQEILQRKLIPQYRNGFWDSDTAYYTQNIVWLGLLPPTEIDAQLLQPQ
jgi:endoglucanase